MANTAANDKTVNKVALCSAIFAGFAYVGYSVVRTAFCRKLGKRDGEVYQDEHRLYFRRLSQTTQTDVLLGSLDLSDSGRVVLRPITVQERIRQLNLQARMFTDTVLAIQTTSGHSPRHFTGHTSLQCSPWSSPRILSPVDMRHILTSRSTENLSSLGMIGRTGELVTSPVRRRTIRKSVRKRGKSRSPDTTSGTAGHLHSSETSQDQPLNLHLDNIAHSQREIPRHDAKSLVILLQSNDAALLERTLITISNGATIPANQVMLREVGCLIRVQRLLTHYKPSVQLAAITALGNLALNQDNQRELKDSIPVLCSILLDQPAEKVILQTLVTLLNITVLPDWHMECCIILHHLYQLVDTGSFPVKVHALKVLINLTCNDDMIPSLLAAQAPRKLLHLLDLSTNEDLLLRIVTLLANLTQGVRNLNIDPILDLPLEDKAPSPDTMYAAIYGVNVQDKICSKAFTLMSSHMNEDIRIQARKIVEAMKP
ncbi:armadillo repeat-containing X-linked protein 3-like [Rhodnius prolixus]|uniref:armadillo repeat-containing X-linked protein 3-like n=1 Tax=Rhodnius prolixus TaxID=13249 RepID=UPI003D18AC3B